MKKALRILVPLILVVAIIATTAWYFLIYDRELTKELILQTARGLESNGKHEAAAWVYDLAYSHSSHEDNVAIELSNQYRDSGNYTKAEYTLTEAIAKNPTTELYMALSQLYITQDKLLDAMNLISTVLDPSIKAELESLRPKIPTVSHNPGFYSQYINVSVASDSGILFVSTDGDYPSTEKDLYQDPLPLTIGETVLHCIVVGENGLVSPLGLFSYTIAGVVEEVTLSDSKIDALIRQQLNVGENTQLYTNDLWNITDFTVPSEVSSYEDLALLTELRSLTLHDASAGVITVLSNHDQLTDLRIAESSLNAEDMQTISSLPSLKSLTITGCNLSSIAGLDNLSGLEYLDLSANALRNLSSLSKMLSLKELYLSHNAITDLSAISTITGLTVLDVSYNSISSLDSICNLSSLSELNAAQNNIANIEPLHNLTELVELDLSYNKITDVSSLAVCTALEGLNISNNSVTDVSMLSTLTQLERFYLRNNQISALPAFSATSPLVTIDASYNLLLTIEELTALPHLNSVNIDYNEAVDSLEPLRECPVLIQVNAFGTMVTEVAFLTEQSIVVNFDPTI